MPDLSKHAVYRIAGFYAASFAIASLLVAAATWTFAHRTLHAALDYRLEAELSTLQQAQAREGRGALIADIAARDAAPEDGGYVLIGSNGRRLAGKTRIDSIVPGLSDITLMANGPPRPARVAARRLANGDLLAVVAETGSLTRIETALLAISGVGLAVTVAIGAIGSLLAGHATHRRLSAVEQTARAIIDGDLTQRLPIGAANDEFDQLSAILNEMLDHMARLMHSLRHVSDDIAHDLRTPLTRLRVVLELAKDTPDQADCGAGIEEALVRLDAVIVLFASILRIGELEQGDVRRRFVPVRLDQLAAEIIDFYAFAADESGQQIVADIIPGIIVHGDENLLGNALVNLVENAIKHTPRGTRICVAVSATGDGRAMLAVHDDGRGVPVADHTTILRRFGRLEASRSTPGHGLGLTLVAAIATTHRADLLLGDAMPGLRVTMIFPAKV